MLTLLQSSQHFVTLPSECLVLLRLNGRPGHRDLQTSSKFAQVNHPFPPSAKGVVLPMDERFLSLYFDFSLGGEFLCQAFFVYFEFSRLPHIERCVDYCLWSTTGHCVKFVNRIRCNTLYMSITYNCVPIASVFTIEKQGCRDTERQRERETERKRETLGDTGTHRHRDTEIQRHLHTKPQRHRDTET